MKKSMMAILAFAALCTLTAHTAYGYPPSCDQRLSELFLDITPSKKVETLYVFRKFPWMMSFHEAKITPNLELLLRAPRIVTPEISALLPYQLNADQISVLGLCNKLGFEQGELIESRETIAPYVVRYNSTTKSFYNESNSVSPNYALRIICKIPTSACSDL